MEHAKAVFFTIAWTSRLVAFFRDHVLLQLEDRSQRQEGPEEAEAAVEVARHSSGEAGEANERAGLCKPGEGADFADGAAAVAGAVAEVVVVATNLLLQRAQDAVEGVS